MTSLQPVLILLTLLHSAYGAAQHGQPGKKERVNHYKQNAAGTNQFYHTIEDFFQRKEREYANIFHGRMTIAAGRKQSKATAGKNRNPDYGFKSEITEGLAKAEIYPGSARSTLFKGHHDFIITLTRAELSYAKYNGQSTANGEDGLTMGPDTTWAQALWYDYLDAIKRSRTSEDTEKKNDALGEIKDRIEYLIRCICPGKCVINSRGDRYLGTASCVVVGCELGELARAIKSGKKMETQLTKRVGAATKKEKLCKCNGTGRIISRCTGHSCKRGTGILCNGHRCKSCHGCGNNIIGDSPRELFKDFLEYNTGDEKIVKAHNILGKLGINIQNRLRRNQSRDSRIDSRAEGEGPGLTATRRRLVTLERTLDEIRRLQ